MKPILVYKYSSEKVERDNEFFEEFESHADEIRDQITYMRGSDTHSARIHKFTHEDNFSSNDGNQSRRSARVAPRNARTLSSNLAIQK